MQVTIGGFNAMLHAKRDEDIQIEPHVFGRGVDFLDGIYLPEHTNRILF